MKNNILSRIFGKIISHHLRRPSGFLAKRIGEKMNESNEELYDLTLRSMKPENGDSILEIGFGNGKFFDRIFSMAENLTINGLDFSAEMVRAATKNNPQTIRNGKLQLQPGNSDKMPFADNEFDKIICLNVIYFWENPDEHLREIFRVLKPGGKFFCGIKSKESMQKMPFTAQGFRLYEAEDLAIIFLRNGFTNIGFDCKTSKESGNKDKLICLSARR